MDANHITVTALREGFRRSGRAWSALPTTVSRDELTADQIVALVDDPALVVTCGETGWDGVPTPVPLEEIVAAIDRLDRDVAGNWTSDGRPQVRRLEAELGRPISADERDAAWAARQGAA